jgi:hypothetical protein
MKVVKIQSEKIDDKWKNYNPVNPDSDKIQSKKIDDKCKITIL